MDPPMAPRAPPMHRDPPRMTPPPPSLNIPRALAIRSLDINQTRLSADPVPNVSREYIYTYENSQVSSALLNGEVSPEQMERLDGFSWSGIRDAYGQFHPSIRDLLAHRTLPPVELHPLLAVMPSNMEAGIQTLRGHELVIAGMMYKNGWGAYAVLPWSRKIIYAFPPGSAFAAGFGHHWDPIIAALHLDPDEFTRHALPFPSNVGLADSPAVALHVLTNIVRHYSLHAPHFVLIETGGAYRVVERGKIGFVVERNNPDEPTTLFAARVAKAETAILARLAGQGLDPEDVDFVSLVMADVADMEARPGSGADVFNITGIPLDIDPAGLDAIVHRGRNDLHGVYNTGNTLPAVLTDFGRHCFQYGARLAPFAVYFPFG